MAHMFLNGGAMRGGPLHHLLDDSPLIASTRTAPKYRFYSVDDVCPALHPVSHGGASVAGELYDVPLDVLRDKLLPAEPPALELGVIEMADGSSSFAMLLRRGYSGALIDITAHGDWMLYRSKKGSDV
ncbi:gamma-glutamylcyclotransferase [Kibdelosporangium aridum]|uniref:Gamma-glutamylcyclotransferase n=1 Tax=Kibdelosporangium aridum TaxID=2030 RepID=A0A428ZF82_KIBAR|nr:gamma-glutamylcyclotransferase [Kibdelosporangium aridum]RSM86631.1 gamma-glutamylcyclotransferase [Kibdelosporangium aridum]